MIVTRQDINRAMTPKGGFTGKQVEWAKSKTGQGKWMPALMGMEVDEAEWSKFIRLGIKQKKQKKKEIINPVPAKPDGWSWKPEANDVPKVKIKGGKLKSSRGKGKARRARITKKCDEKFYASKEWRELRVRALERYDCKCMMCGRSPKEHGIVIHVDHIKPRSKYPQLSLNFDNLQLLCADCNVGKGNRYETDWRPEEVLDLEHLASISHLTG